MTQPHRSNHTGPWLNDFPGKNKYRCADLQQRGAKTLSFSKNVLEILVTTPFTGTSLNKALIDTVQMH